MIFPVINLIELDDGTIYRKPIYLMVKTMVFCRFSLKPIHKPHETSHSSAFCRRRRQRRRHPNTWAQRSCRAHLATRKQYRLQSNKWEIIGIYHIIWGYVCQCIYCFCIYIYGFIHDDILIDCCLLMLNKGQSLNMGDISIRLKLAVVDDGWW